MARDPDAAARRRWTLVLVNLASVLEKADEVLLPAVYREVGAALGASPTALGSLTLCRALVQAACYPLAAYASARHDRARVVAAGAFLWAAATFLVAVSGTYVQVRRLHHSYLDLLFGSPLFRVLPPLTPRAHGSPFLIQVFARHAGTAYQPNVAVLSEYSI